MEGCPIGGCCAIVVTAFLASVTLANDGRLHVIIAADTNDPEIGPSVRVDIGWVTQIVEANAPKRKLSLRVLQGRSLSGENWLRAIRGLSVVPQHDSVLVYFSGHGDYDARRRQHRFMARQWQLDRSAVRQEIERLQPRVGALVTDTCSVFKQTPVPAPVFPPAEEFTPLFQELFFARKGFADISATQPGQIAVGTSYGGIFTFAWFRAMTLDPSQRMSWSEVIARTNQYVREDPTAALREGLAVRQTAYAISALPVAASDPIAGNGPVIGPPAWGITVERTEGSALFGGVQVTRVTPNSPATRILGRDGKTYALAEQRDIITHVNGQAVTTAEAFNQAVSQSLRTMVLTVHDLGTQTAADYEVTAADQNAVPAAQKLKLGIIAGGKQQSAAFGGVQVLEVSAGSPVTRMNGRDGHKYILTARRDIITHVNSVRVRTVQELIKAWENSPPDLVLRVHDLVTGTSADYDVDLRP
jgi:hypothetical protein